MQDSTSINSVSCVLCSACSFSNEMETYFDLMLDANCLFVCVVVVPNCCCWQIPLFSIDFYINFDEKNPFIAKSSAREHETSTKCVWFYTLFKLHGAYRDSNECQCPPSTVAWSMKHESHCVSDKCAVNVCVCERWISNIFFFVLPYEISCEWREHGSMWFFWL